MPALSSVRLRWKTTGVIERALWISLFALGGWFVAASLLAIASFPYHSHDALAYGEWSRLIAEKSGFKFPSIAELSYQRPLSYVLQGLLWRLTGISEPAGRLLSALLGATLFLAAALAARRWQFRTGGAAVLLAWILLLNVPSVGLSLSQGLTDVPVAGLVAMSAVLALATPSGPGTTVAVVFLSAAAGLSKPSALVALVSLASAALLVPGRSASHRVRFSLAVLLGTAAAVAYQILLARSLGISPFRLLAGPLVGYYQMLAATGR